MAVTKTDKVVTLEMPVEIYALPEQTEELPLGEILKVKRARATVTSHSSVTATGKRVAKEVPVEGKRGKTPRDVNVPGQKDRAMTFEVLSPNAPELPRARLNRVLEEAGMADEGFVRQMVADMTDVSVDKLLAAGATPQENRDKMLQYMMRVCSTDPIFSLSFVLFALFGPETICCMGCTLST